MAKKKNMSIVRLILTKGQNKNNILDTKILKIILE